MDDTLVSELKLQIAELQTRNEILAQQVQHYQQQHEQGNRPGAEPSMHRYQGVVSATPDHIYVIDRHYTYQLANQAYLDWHQKSQKAIVGHLVSEILGEDVFQTVVKPRIDRCLTGETIQYETWFSDELRADQHEVPDRFVSVSYAPYREIDGSISGVVVSSRDVTRLKQAEEALQIQVQREQALNRVIQAIRQSLDLEVIFSTATAEIGQLLNVDHVTITRHEPASQSWQPSAEYRRDSSIPTGMGIHIPDHDNPVSEQLKRDEMVCFNNTTDDCGALANRNLAQLYPGAWLMVPLSVGSSTWGYIGIHHLNRSWIWQQSEIDLARSIADHLAIAIHQAQLYQQLQSELAEHQRMETALRESNQFLQSVYAYIQASIFVVDVLDDGDFRFSGLNPVHETLTGISTENFRGKTPEQVLPADLAANVRQHYRQCVETRQSITYEEYLPFRGKDRWWITTLMPLLDENSRVYRLIGNSLDITERVEAEREREHHRYKAQLISDITLKIRQSIDLNEILQTTVDEVQRWLEADRSVIYRFSPEDWSGTISTEAVSAPEFSLLGQRIHDPCFGSNYVEAYQNGRVRAIANVAQSDLAPCHQKFLYQLSVQANLVVPLLQDQQLWGLLIIHHCSAPRQWRRDEIEFVQQLADQVSIAVQQANLYQQAQLELSERRRAEAALQQLNQELEERVQQRTAQLQLAISASKMGIWESDLSTDVQYWSPENYELLGFKRGDQGQVLTPDGVEVAKSPTNEFFFSRVHPDDQLMLVRTEAGIVAERPFNEAEYRIILPDNTVRWRYSRSSHIFDDQGTPIKLLGVALDITERKQAEITLRESEERFSKVFQSSPVGIAISTFPDGVVLDVNDSYLALLGYQRQDIIGQRTMDLEIWENQAERDRQIRKLENHQSVRNIETRLRTRTGEVRTCILSLERIELGDRPCILKIFYDISDRKRVEAALKQRASQEQLLRNITQQIRRTLDLDDILEAAVNQVRQIFQADRALIFHFTSSRSGIVLKDSVLPAYPLMDIKTWEDECFPKACYEHYWQGNPRVVHDVMSDIWSECLVDYMQEMCIKSKIVAPILQKSDSPSVKVWGLLIVHACAEPRQWQSEEAEFLQQIANQLAIAIQQSDLYQQLRNELSDRKQAEQTIRASLEEKNVLLKEIHHRVKNNLQIISSLMRMQLRRTPDDALTALFQEAQNRIRSMALIHEQLYQAPDLSNIDFGVYLQTLVSNLFQTYGVSREQIQLDINTHGIHLTLDNAIPCGLIVNELVSNSLKYAFPGEQSGYIMIRLQVHPVSDATLPPTLKLIVGDDGVGIPDSVDYETTRSLGLRIVRNLANQLRGSITFERHQGTVFHVTFPSQICSSKER